MRSILALSLVSVLACARPAPERQPAALPPRDSTQMPVSAAQATKPPVFLPVVLDSKPRAIESPLPPSLDSLARAVKPGRVMVEFIVDTMGVPEPGSVRVLTSPDTALSRAAAAAVLLWRFRPGRVHGHPVRVLVEVPLDFRIKSN